MRAKERNAHRDARGLRELREAFENNEKWRAQHSNSYGPPFHDLFQVTPSVQHGDDL